MRGTEARAGAGRTPAIDEQPQSDCPPSPTRLHRSATAQFDPIVVVNVDDQHLHLVADSTDIRDAVDVFVGELADVAQAIAARQDFDKGAKVLDAGHAALVDLADLHRGRQRLDLGQSGLRPFGVAAGNRDAPVVVDVDDRPGRLLDRANRLAAGSDQQADLFGVDQVRSSRGAQREVSSRGREIVVSMDRRISMRASRDCAMVARIISPLIPSIFRSN